MKREDKNTAKELYQQLRRLPWEQLWNDEAAKFNRAAPADRDARVALVRAVGVVFAESGPAEQKAEVTAWLRALLRDPSEKIRRYAIAALPKIGTSQNEEAELLSLLQTTTVEREKKYLTQALEKLGGTATLETAKEALPARTAQKVKASVARAQSPSAIRLEGVLSEFAGLRIHLRGRRGLEAVVRHEVEEFIQRHGKFSFAMSSAGLVALTPVAPFSLADLYTMRCFGTVGFVPSARGGSAEELPSIITSPLSRRILQAFTEGAFRYRLNFVGHGHQRGAVRALAARVYELCPEILNDARRVTWTLDVFQGDDSHSVEWRPNLTPDPRFAYRKREVPASSHPQLAAGLARLAGRHDSEIVWDPFCGSGMELIERALLGPVREMHGTDLSAEAISIAQENFAAANLRPTRTHFVQKDFRKYGRAVLKPESVTLVLTNPPMGMRVPIADLHGLINDLFAVAAKVLKPGGRLVLANPVRMKKIPAGFRLQTQQAVDFGGFDCRMEKYIKLGR